jgi:MFS family permease
MLTSKATHIRSQGTAIAMAGMSLASVILLVAGPIGLDAIGWRFYFVVIIPPAIEFVCVYLFFPETKQRSLEDIAEVFGDKVAVHFYQSTAEEQLQYAEAEAKIDMSLGIGKRDSSGEDGNMGQEQMVEDVGRKA